MPDNPSGMLTATSGIGSLRWLVTLFRRDQMPGPDGAVSERFHRLAKVHADIQPTYPSTFYLSAQIEGPITHMIRLRWQDYPETTNVITRTTRRPSDDSLRAEIFRVRRVKEVGGRKRFVEIEAEFERWASPTGDSDDELELAFAENPVVH